MHHYFGKTLSLLHHVAFHFQCGQKQCCYFVLLLMMWCVLSGLSIVPSLWPLICFYMQPYSEFLILLHTISQCTPFCFNAAVSWTINAHNNTTYLQGYCDWALRHYKHKTCYLFQSLSVSQIRCFIHLALSDKVIDGHACCFLWNSFLSVLSAQVWYLSLSLSVCVWLQRLM